MDLTTYVDVTCERLAAGVWGEPVNAVSAFAFLISGWLGYRLYRSTQLRATEVAVLPALVLLLAFASISLHLFAVAWTHYLFITTLSLFVVASVVIFCVWVRGSGLMGVGLIATFYVMLHYVFTQHLLTAYTLQPAAPYIAAMPILLYMTQQVRQIIYGKGGYFMLAAFLLALALLFKALDMPMCGIAPHGTYYFWNLYLAATLYMVMRGLILSANHHPQFSARR